MNSRLLLIACVALSVAGCATTPRFDTVEENSIHAETAAAEELVLATQGESGQLFEGLILVDGEEQRVSGTSPSAIPIQGAVVSGTLVKKKGNGSLSFSIYNTARTRSVGLGKLTRSGSSCRFVYHDGQIKVFTKQ